jgi:stalled ribosome alternative rescue factor ArfA
MFFQKGVDIQGQFVYIKSMEKGQTHKAKDAKRRNPIARVLRENKLFTSRVIRAKVSYNRKTKHRKGEYHGYD